MEKEKIRNILQEYDMVITEVNKIAKEKGWSSTMKNVLEERINDSFVGILHSYLISDKKEFVRERIDMIEDFRKELREKKYSEEEILHYVSALIDTI